MEMTEKRIERAPHDCAREAIKTYLAALAQDKTDKKSRKLSHTLLVSL